jgi:hypothetical protein
MVSLYGAFEAAVKHMFTIRVTDYASRSSLPA